jgi:aspartate racemase
VGQNRELVVGVMGGLGPEATLDFYGKLLQHSHAATDQQHLHVIIDSNPKVPNRNDAIAGRGPSSGPMLAAMARRLEAAGSDFIVMACNTAHAFEADIRAALSTPFVSLIDEVVSAVVATKHPSSVVGLLAAQGCIDAGIYHRAFAAQRLRVIQLEVEKQAQFMQLLYRIKSGDRDAGVRSAMRALGADLVGAGATTVIAACTEVPLVLTAEDLTVPFVDSTDLLARRCVAYARHEEALPKAVEIKL